MSSNDYYGNTGGGGGGFLAGGSPYGSTSGSPGGAGRKSEIAHSLRPLTAFQLLNATQAHSDAEWMLDDTELGQVTIVGHVVSIQSQATNNLYWLDDGTGRIEARHWIDSSVEETGSNAITEGSYVRVSGSLKMFGNKRYVNANHIRPVKSPHEIYFHLLEAMTVTLIWQRGPPLRPGQNPSTTVPPAVSSNVTGSSAYTAQSHTAAANNSQFSHLPKLQYAIVTFIQSQHANEEGVHVGAIARAVGGTAVTISNALDTLMDDGLVFTTIDDSHFQIAA
ncbi:replication protein A, subunit RPA32 [Rhizopogon vinicolor AM-OR11-026]|uniref:Replication protein A, subunit RPA32 n=1 Tax=Rhizopogon vinicolor AM-OR11-026 TaxID=1314800 RepID=A0A1B7NAR7_9AGAM|nr:replication protein A, subunit RPA32 [Rhizopogon vinicolor AM-OR11-026]